MSTPAPHNATGKPMSWADLCRTKETPGTHWDVAVYNASWKVFIRAGCNICKATASLAPPEVRHEFVTENRPNGPQRVQKAIFPTPESMMDEARAFRFVHCGGNVSEPVPEEILADYERRNRAVFARGIFNR